jgi:dipeptidyl-peptidase-4
MGPGGRYYIDTWSSLTEPPRSILHAGDGAALGTYREQDRTALDEYVVLPSAIESFTTPDGVALYGRLIRPAGWKRRKRYPVVVSVYGGPGVDLPVHNAWPGITIDQVLAQRGYLVWQCENRGGQGRGHDFETAIYHRLGVAELADQVAGVRHLVADGPGRSEAHRDSRLELWRLYDRQRHAQRAGCFQAPVSPARRSLIG